MEFTPSFFSKPNEEPPKEDSSLMAKVRNSNIARAGLIAIGLHGAALGSGELKEGIAHAAEVSRLWNDSEAVLRPQTDQQRRDVEKKMNERLARKDEKGLVMYRQEAAKLLDEGKNVEFEELYFKQAELNGVSHEDIVKAKAEVEGMVRHFSAKLENGLTDDEIRDISCSMYDSAEYEWGQGSVVDYFTLHKRNCVSIEQAQEIVFERLFQLLPERQRSRYTLGTRFENQHRIATVGVSQSANLASERFILLQPPYETERAGFAPAGTAMASGEQVKAALVGRKVIVKSVEVEKGEEIHTGPRIDAEVNQPVDDGIVVEGALRSADANERQAKREGIEPISGKEYREKYQRVMEIDLSYQDTTEMKGVKDQSAKAMKERMFRELETYSRILRVDLSDFSSPDAESLRTFSGTSGYGAFPFFQLMGFYEFGDLSKWNAEAIDVLANLQDIPAVSVVLDAEGGVRREFIQAIEKRKTLDRNWRALEIRQFKKPGAKKFDSERFSLLLKTLKNRHVDLILDIDEMPKEGYGAIIKNPPQSLSFSKRLKALWAHSEATSEDAGTQYASWALRHLDVPVYVEVTENSGSASVDYAWIADAYSGSVFPSFSSLVDLAESGHWETTKFGSALDSQSLQVDIACEQMMVNPKAVLLKKIMKELDTAYKDSSNAVETADLLRNVRGFYEDVFVGSREFEKLRKNQGALTSAELESLEKKIGSFFHSL